MEIKFASFNLTSTTKRVILYYAMEPFKEQKRDLKTNYVENGWLTKQDISLAVKAYRLAKSDTDMSQLIDMVEAFKSQGVGQ